MNNGRIAIFVDYFSPGYLGGGCVRAVENLTLHLGGEFDLTVFTRDRDLGSTQPYSEESRSKTRDRLHCAVKYLPPGPKALKTIRDGLVALRPDFIHLNSAFSPVYSLWPLFISRRQGIPVLTAPRGEFLHGAMASKSAKKNCFLALVRNTSLWRSQEWHATSFEEFQVISGLGVAKTQIHLAADVLDPAGEVLGVPRPKRPGEIDLIFLGRIHPMKGLHRLLQWLRDIRGVVRLEVVGALSDEAYGQLCHKLCGGLPDTVKVTWMGPLPHGEVMDAFTKAHASVLPTESENNGYTIHEALVSGCPVLTSTGTPWHELEPRGAGRTLTLDSDISWVDALQAMVDMGPSEYASMRAAAQNYGGFAADKSAALEQTRAMFCKMLKKGAAH